MCTSCGRPWAGSAGSDGPRGGSQVAPPVPPQLSHPFSDARELVVRLAPEGSEPPGLQILDDGRQVRGTLRGDGGGFHLLLRNFVLEDAAHRVVYRFHRPPARLPLAMGGVCYLVQPDGR
ncbi:MAG: hypothetical protein L3J91_02125, partial [Thermoplasmata archaeon]|nr:hypothetical protein [Thermoplasmata archaeon]